MKYGHSISHNKLNKHEWYTYFMGLFIQQDGKKSELQNRLETELREKAKEKAKIANERPDGVEDSAYVNDMKTTTSLAWAWVLIVVLTIFVIIRLIIS